MKRIVQGVLVKKAVGPGRSRSGDWGVHGELSRLFVLNLDCCVRHSAPENIRPHTTPDQEQTSMPLDLPCGERRNLISVPSWHLI